jgi:hypothetical protein
MDSRIQTRRGRCEQQSPSLVEEHAETPSSVPGRHLTNILIRTPCVEETCRGLCVRVEHGSVEHPQHLHKPEQVSVFHSFNTGNADQVAIFTRKAVVRLDIGISTQHPCEDTLATEWTLAPPVTLRHTHAKIIVTGGGSILLISKRTYHTLILGI